MQLAAVYAAAAGEGSATTVCTSSSSRRRVAKAPDKTKRVDGVAAAALLLPASAETGWPQVDEAAHVADGTYRLLLLATSGIPVDDSWADRKDAHSFFPARPLFLLHVRTTIWLHLAH